MEDWLTRLDPWVQQGAAAAGPLQVWVLPALLGLGLAAATGLRVFLPLLLLALAVKFELFGIRLNPEMEWLVADAAVAALGVASLVEVLADKIPVVDNLLQAVGLVIRPIAAVVAAGSVFWAVDPLTAAVAGLIVGAPAALAFAGASGGARATSTATTGGIANPVLSLIEDLAVGVLVISALVAPLLVPLVVLVALWLVVSLFLRARRRRRAQRAAAVAHG